MKHKWDLSKNDNLTTLVGNGCDRVTIFYNNGVYKIARSDTTHNDNVFYHNDGFETELEAIQFCDNFYDVAQLEAATEPNKFDYNGCDYGVNAYYEQEQELEDE